MFLTLFVNSFFLISQVPTNEQQFDILKTQLEKYHFQVLIEQPPQRGAYGLLQPKTKKIWISPVVFDLHIATQTIVHEAVHAAQVCKGKGEITLLGLDIKPIIYAQPFYMNYVDIHRKDLEKEAFAVQTQPNRFELVLSLLSKYCQ